MKYKLQSQRVKLTTRLLILLGSASTVVLLLIAPSFSKEKHLRVDRVTIASSSNSQASYYQPVHDTLRKPQVRPYEDWGKLTWKEAMYQYRYWLGFVGVLIVGFTYGAVYSIQRKNNEIRLLQTQEELRNSKQLLQLVMDNIPQCIFWKDRNSVYLGCNQNFAMMVGVDSAEKILGLTDYDLSLNQEEIDFCLECDRRVMESDVPELGIIESMLQADGKLRWLETNKVPLHNEEGKVIGILGTFQDITVRKEAELALQQSKEALEIRVSERTAELIAAKEAAEVASQAKSEFLSSMSHELRTPLNGILGYAQILQRDRSLTPNQSKGLKIIKDSGNHLLTLINDILDLSKIEARKLELYPTDIHLDLFLSGIDSIFRMEAMEKGIDFKCQALTPLPTGIVADEKRLRQILFNLLGNAVKFTDCGQVTLNISVVPRPILPQEPENSNFFNLQQFSDELIPLDKSRSPLNPPNLGDFENSSPESWGARGAKTAVKILRFEVIDTGIGINTQQLDQIFHAFEQVGEKKHREAGTGLGLAITKQLVELMGGQLQVRSELGKGSTFWFEVIFPVIETITSTETIDRHKQQIVGYKGQRQRILVADDNKENRLLLLNMLEPLGFEITLAEDGQQAIDLAHEIKPDCILSDLVMPVKTGFEVVKEIRNSPSIQDVIVIVISASVLDLDSHKSEILGCDSFLPKPIDEKKLLDILQKYLQLDWIYEATTESEVNFQSTDRANSLLSLVIPPREELEVLYELAMLGSMKKIRERAIFLQELDEKYASFAIQLQDLAQGFQEKAIVNLVEQYLA